MNFKKFCTIGCMFFFLLLIPGDALAATVHGTVYEWYSFEPLENAVVEVNSTPEQYFVASDAVYSFNLTPGSYLIAASYFEGGTVVYAAEETVTITENGDYVLDLLLFPTYEEELLDQSEFADFDQDFEETELVTEESSRNSIYAFILLTLCALLIAGYFWKKGPRKPLDMSNNLQKSPGGKSRVQPGALGKEYESGTESGTESENLEESGKNGGTFEEFPKQGSDSPVLQAVEEEARGPGTNVQGPGVETLKEDIPEEEGLKGVVFEEKSPEKEISEDGAGEVLREPGVAVPPSISQESVEPDPEVMGDPETYLPEDLKEVLELIRVSGNRITQLELRKKSRYSESKVSLMLSDLEERGMIEKFKKGRGNIIRIPDEQVLKRDNGNKKDRKGKSP